MLSARKLSISIFVFLFFLGIFALLFPATGEAAGLVPCGGEGEQACTLCFGFKLIKNILDVFLFPFVPILASLLIAIGGFFLFTAAGNAQNLGRAKTIFFATVIGLLIVYGSWLFINLLLTSLGVVSFGGPGTWWEIECPLPLACDNPDAEFTVFITSSIHDSASFGGSTRKADAICQTLAGDAGLPGRYTAWVAIGDSDEPKDRGMVSCAAAGANSASWSLVDGTRVADDWADLTDGFIQSSIRMTELGNLVGAGHVNTGIKETGDAYPIEHTCKQWTYNTPDCAAAGQCTCPAFSDGTDAKWTWNSPCHWNCGEPGARLYCFQYAG